VYTAKEDGVGLGFGGFVGEAKGVSHEIGHSLDGLNLVIVGEDEGVGLFF